MPASEKSFANEFDLRDRGYPRIFCIADGGATEAAFCSWKIEEEEE